MNWKDVTSYSRSQTDRTPTAFEAICGPLRLVIVSNHLHYPGVWLACCWPLFQDKQLRDAKTKEDAQAETVRLAREWLASAETALGPNTENGNG